jgi:glycosyltransferase involved in cell wall biosynthesis
VSTAHERPSGPMQVLYVSPHATLGGAERVTMDLIAGHDRAVVAPSVCFLGEGPLVEHCRTALQVPTTVLPRPRLRSFGQRRRTVRAIADLVREQGIALVHSAMAWGHALGGRAAATAGRPAVWYQHNRASWRSAVEVSAARVRARAILANSAFTAADQHRVNPRRATITVVHCGSTLPSEPRERRRERGRAALGLTEEDFAVGIAARLQRAKGQEVVLRAAASLLRARENARVLVIGGSLFDLEPEYAGELKRLAGVLGIADRVTFTGFRDDIPDCLAALDVAVHASIRPETFGLALVEAMAAGTALVAADAGAVREIVTPGADGLLVPPGDHEALAVALLALYDDRELRWRLARAGERTARERFDAAVMTRRVEALYAEILRR